MTQTECTAQAWGASFPYAYPPHNRAPPQGFKGNIFKMENGEKKKKKKTKLIRKKKKKTLAVVAAHWYQNVKLPSCVGILFNTQCRFRFNVQAWKIPL